MPAADVEGLLSRQHLLTWYCHVITGGPADVADDMEVQRQHLLPWQGDVEVPLQQWGPQY